jgi:hypothetical protein
MEKVGPDVTPRLVFERYCVRISAGTPAILRFWWFFCHPGNAGIVSGLGLSLWSGGQISEIPGSISGTIRFFVK